MSQTPRRLTPLHETAVLAGTLARWGALGGLVGVAAGVASALFLHALTWATLYRESHPYLLFGLPLAGYAVGLLYDRLGRSVTAGNNLLLEHIQARRTTAAAIVPFRMAPLVLIGTVVTHLFGGSAGREGTAVQMGGALAEVIARAFRLGRRDRRLLLMCGISGGFGAVFGTPLAGTVFGLEVPSLGRIRYEGIVPCFVSAVVGDVVCRALGIHHTAYSVGVPLPAFTAILWLCVLLASVLFAAASAIFIELTEAIVHAARSRIARPELRPVVGGLAVIALTYLVQSSDYLGLSLPLIERSFTPGGVAAWAFALKILFTAVTLGTGFKGGEVTPLFAIGATLGAAFGALTGQPVGFFAALGFVAVFAGAANTPLACTLMGIELFGGGMAVPLAAACIVAYVLTGHRGIYLSQHIGASKGHGVIIRSGTSLRDARAGRMRFRRLARAGRQ
jgi:H+/Cl- antiporter ClcA